MTYDPQFDPTGEGECESCDTHGTLNDSDICQRCWEDQNCSGPSAEEQEASWGRVSATAWGRVSATAPTYYGAEYGPLVTYGIGK